MLSIIAVQSPRCLEMQANDPYNEEVRRCFETPVHAGDVEGEYPEVLVADVSESANGARLIVSAGVEDGMLAEIRFRTFGCPHLVAAAELVCSELENGPLERLAAIGTNRLMERLAVPVGKTGRLFLVEDALRLLHRQAGCTE